jgi:hypothetical protein
MTSAERKAVAKCCPLEQAMDVHGVALLSCENTIANASISVMRVPRYMKPLMLDHSGVQYVTRLV